MGLGCSDGGDLSLPNGDPGFEGGMLAPPPGEGRALWGVYQFIVDPDTLEIEIIADREVNKHFNVTTMLQDPMICPNVNCITVHVAGVEPGQIFKIGVTLRNPTLQKAYDVRGIMVNQPGKHELTNPDNYTDLWFGSPNPFKAFAKSAIKRRFPPASTYTEDYYIHFPGPPFNFNVTYAIDVSWPKNCQEPFWIKDVEVEGEMTPNRGCAFLSLKCFDWNGTEDIESVEVDTYSFSGNITSLEHESGTYNWSGLILNSFQTTVGDYECLISAKSYDSALYLYDYVTLSVVEDQLNCPYQGTVHDNDSGSKADGATVTTSDGTQFYTAIADKCGDYELPDVPEGKRVLSFSKAYYITSHYSTIYEGDPLLVDGYMTGTFESPPPLPEVTIDDPEVDYDFGEASITGIIENLDYPAAVIVINHQEYLMEVDPYTHAYFYSAVLNPGPNVVRVRATNATGSVFSDEKYIEIGQAEYPFRVKLTWDKVNDQDLHGWDPDFQHVYFLNMEIPTMDLDIDIITAGYGPEHITGSEVIPGRYYFAVDYYLEHDESGPTNCTVDVLLNPGTIFEEEQSFQHVLLYGDTNDGYPVTGDTDSWWRVCDIVLDDNLVATLETPDTSVELWE